ncbi:MAG TPA: beta-aspartyl-peptidase [Holophaga sp.]|nr:beta-aspartyl-peptidase [Holophaga sp.]
MLTLIRDIPTYAPEPLGVVDILLAGGLIAHVGRLGPVNLPGLREVDGRGLVAVPGFIDAHVHILGGGGEGGCATRTPELMLGEALRAGVTTLVGCLGTDGVSRTPASLLAKAKGLEEEGLTTYAYTGSYGLPLVTATGSVERDLLLVDRVIGVGEVALSDHRSSQPTLEALAALAGEARRGGLLSGKAGVVNLHLGDGPRGLEPLRRLVAETELPPSQFLPTHINRNPALLEEAVAYAALGGWLDLTTSGPDPASGCPQVGAAEAHARLRAAGVDPGRITFTSDGQGSLPEFDAQGRMTGLGVGRMRSLFDAFRDLVRAGTPLAEALLPVTANPAAILRLRGKGRLRAGMDADLLLLGGGDLEVHSLVARGRLLVEDGVLKAKGTFES